MPTQSARGGWPRSSGVLLHVTSLPGPHGVGDLGPAAQAWVDLLADAGQTWWQILPLGPTGAFDSPYQCYSAFAGNPNLISLERLVEDGLLRPGDLPAERFPAHEAAYERAAPLKEQATAAAFDRFQAGAGSHLAARFNEFCRTQDEWLAPFALFAALKDLYAGAWWLDWPAEHRGYDPDALRGVRHKLAREVELHQFRQFLFYDQWRRLRAHAHERGVRLIGDMPIFVSGDSADVWSRPELFQLDHDRRPTAVAGVPPDYFSATGQLWGNPLYAWERHRATGFAWWLARLRTTLEHVDLVRLDHFRGFEAYWAVPAGHPTAERGQWIPAPGRELFHTLQRHVGPLPLIAEDLGVITPPVDALRQEFELPGMRVLQFAFGGAQEDRFLPHRYDRHTVVYTGTHDNETTLGWFQAMTEIERRSLVRYAPDAKADPVGAMIRLAWGSVADLAIVPLQDVLRLGNEARMNLPGTAAGNWRWRVEPPQLTPCVLDGLAELTATYQRLPQSHSAASVAPPAALNLSTAPVDSPLVEA